MSNHAEKEKDFVNLGEQNNPALWDRINLPTNQTMRPIIGGSVCYRCRDITYEKVGCSLCLYCPNYLVRRHFITFAKFWGDLLRGKVGYCQP